MGAAQVPGDGLHRSAVHRRRDVRVQLPQQRGAARGPRGRGRTLRAGLCAKPAHRHRLSAEDVLRGRSSSSRASTWAACSAAVSSRWAAPLAHDEDEFDMHEALDSGLAGAVKDNDSKFPPEWRLSKSGRKKAKAGNKSDAKAEAAKAKSKKKK